jgi:hypothetical protein
VTLGIELKESKFEINFVKDYEVTRSDVTLLNENMHCGFIQNVLYMYQQLVSHKKSIDSFTVKPRDEIFYTKFNPSITL